MTQDGKTKHTHALLLAGSSTLLRTLLLEAREQQEVVFLLPEYSVEEVEECMEALLLRQQKTGDSLFFAFGISLDLKLEKNDQLYEEQMFKNEMNGQDHEATQIKIINKDVTFQDIMSKKMMNRRDIMNQDVNTHQDIIIQKKNQDINNHQGFNNQHKTQDNDQETSKEVIPYQTQQDIIKQEINQYVDIINEDKSINIMNHQDIIIERKYQDPLNQDTKIIKEARDPEMRKKERERRRELYSLAVASFLRGENPSLTGTAKKFGVKRSTLMDWVRHAKKGKGQRDRGRMSKVLTPEEEERLAEEMLISGQQLTYFYLQKTLQDRLFRLVQTNPSRLTGFESRNQEPTYDFTRRFAKRHGIIVKKEKI